MGSFSVGQAVTDSVIRSAGSVGKVTVGALINSSLLVGVKDSVAGLPSASTDFVADDSLLSFTVTQRERPYSFSNSNVAAASMGKVVVGRVNPGNNAVPFGFATKALIAFTNKGVLKWTSKQPLSALTPDGDFVVRILT